MNLVRSHFPAFRLSLALGTFRASDSSKAIVCSAVEIVFPPGVFITTMPRRLAAATSMLSTPTPARTIAFNRDCPSRTSAVSCVPERIAIPSALLERLTQTGRILGQLGVDHDLDPRLGAKLREPLFSELVRYQYTMRCHPRLPSDPPKSGRNRTTIFRSRADILSSADRDRAFWPIKTCCAAVMARPGSTS